MRDVMRRHEGKVDVCIVGAGAAGCTLAKTLAEGGLSVVVLEAGPWLDTVKDFFNDELEMLGKFDWDETRIADGANPIPLGRQNSGRAVGGSTIHFTAMKLRLQPDDFRLRTNEGIADDWPFDLDELKPYYDEAEHFVGISGPRDFPWGDYPGGFQFGAISMNAGDELIARGLEERGFRWRVTPHAIITGPKGDRKPCMNYGFCSNGCKSDAKGSATVTWVPAAVKAGAEFRDNCVAAKINVNGGRATSVTYFEEGSEKEQLADLIIVSCYAVETPRLLLNSASPEQPDGLSNSSGLVGKRLMVHPADIAFGRFADPLDNFTTPPVGIMTLDPHGTQAGRGYKRGFLLNRYNFFPIEFATTLVESNPNIWGNSLLEIMDSYTHWTILTSQNEMLPREDNRVSLADEKDVFGLPVARVTMSYDENDKAMLEDTRRVCEDVLKAAGAEQVLHAKGNYHLLGTCRMGNDPRESVVDQNCRSWDVPNLFICDGSVFVTEGCVNPSLTIEAIALRTAKRILEGVVTEPRKEYLA